MLKRELIAILRCPDDGSRLTIADDDVVGRINSAIRTGQLTSRGGTRLDETIHGGLIREDGAWLYPIIDDIPVLLRDDAIALSEFDH